MYGKSLFCRVVRARSVRFFQKDCNKKLLEFLADMPKANSARIAEAQRQRQNITKKSEKYGPSTVYLQVLGSGARGVPNTLYLFTDQKRYLFNCGECTQRLAHEHKVKLSRLDHIFITNKTWRNIGGLPGLSLTLQDVGVPNITLHGPEGLDELYNATKRFVIMKDMNVVMAKCSPSEDFEDNVMNVKYVLLGPHDDLLVAKDLKDLKPAAKKIKLGDTVEKDYEDYKEFIRDDTDYYRHEIRGQLEASTRPMDTKKYVKERTKPRPATEKSADKMMKKTEKVLHDLQKKSNCSVAYICTLKKRFGTLDLAKCVEFGVKPGPMLGQLKSGQDVVLPDGTLILSKDVKTPDDPGPVFIVLDVPELSYLKESEFSSHFDDGVNPAENIPVLVVHYTPPHVFHQPAYTSFMKLFGPSTRHLIMNTQNSCLGSEAVHRTQHKLHLLDPDIFPLLRDVSVPAVWNAHPPLPKTNSPVRMKGLEELKNKIALAQFQNIINMEGSCKGDAGGAGADDSDEDRLEMMAARTLTMFHLRPKRQLDRSAEPKLHIQDYIQETMDVDGFVPSLEQFRRLVDSMRYARTGAQEFPKVVFLGTGSCIPSKTRNTSAIVVHVDEERSILLDCGEGTFGQLVRFYGPKRVNAFLRTLKAVYVSHLHADHHIGLIGVLQARNAAHAELSGASAPAPLYLLAPGQIVSWLSMYDAQFERIRGEFTLVPNQNLLEGAKQPEMTSAVLAELGLQRVETCLVTHCPNAFGVSLHIDRHKITYSGDTIPCEALVKLGENSTLLIHEATMEDELAEEARYKMHSTTTQAIDVGRQMNARYTVLTHFSQRYARLPRLNPNILNDNNSVGIAFDNMQITMSDLELLPHMYAPLQLMFAEHCVEMELKAAHRARQKERSRRSSPNLTDTGVDTRVRRLSPGCRGVSSVPAHSPPRYYRESNSSRLRQEMKGMTMSGGMSPRTTSLSPVKKRTSRSPSPSIGPKHLGDCSPDKRLDVIAAPRSMSETSNASRDGERKSPSNVPSGSVVDTRSRTLSAVSRVIEDVESEIKGSHGRRAPLSNNNHMIGDPISNGYGKALITPMNKRLQLRRDVPTQPSGLLTSEKLPPTVRTKSPMRLKAENRLCTSQSSNNKRHLIPVKLRKSIKKGATTISIGGRPTVWTISNLTRHHLGTAPSKRTGDLIARRPSARLMKSPPTSIPVKPKTNLGVVTSVILNALIWRFTHNIYILWKSHRQLVVAIIAVGVLFWAAVKCSVAGNKCPTNPTITVLKTEKGAVPRGPFGGKDAKHDSSYTKIKSANPSACSRDVRSWSAEANSQPRQIIRSPTQKYNSKRSNVNEQQKTEFKDFNRATKQRMSIELTKKSLPSFRESNDNSKNYQTINKDIKPISVMGRPSSAMHSNRSFKPQLEDIKSSFILLSKTANNTVTNDNVKRELDTPPVSKPRPINDDERRAQLIEIKKKFQSRGFFHDSKYNNIEGLNWISWK